MDALSGVDIEIETNGTLAPNSVTLASGARFNVSPKLTHSGDPAEKRIRPDALRALVYSGRGVFKFVAATPADVDETARLARRFGIPPSSVWISPEGVTVPDVLAHQAAVADATIAAGFNLGTRLHTLVWGNERAR